MDRSTRLQLRHKRFLLMRIVKLENLHTGDILGKSLFNKRGELLLASGFQLSDEMIAKIRKSGFHYIYVMDEATRDIVPEEVISDTVRQVANQKLAETIDGVKGNLAFEKFAPAEIKKRLEEDQKLRSFVKVADIRKQVGNILEEIIDNQIMMFSSLPMKSDEGHEMEHAMDVTLLSLLLSREFNFDHREMRALGTSAMLHDIGKMVFPTLLKTPVSELSRDQKMMLREHPVYSMLILQGSEPTAYVEQATVLQHHEQHNGKGFPKGLRGFGRPPIKDRGKDQGFIHRHAEILAVANVYDNMVSGTQDGTVYSPDIAIQKIVNGDTGLWNPWVVKALSKVISVFPKGSMVRINKTATHAFEGYVGVVAKTNESDPHRPFLVLIQNAVGADITPKILDLNSEKHATIELA